MARWTVRILVGLGGLVVVAGLAVVGLLVFGRPRVGFSRSATALTAVRVSGAGARLSHVHATFEGRSIGVSTVDGQLTPVTDLPVGATVDVHATVTAPGWLRWLLGPSTTSAVVVRTPRSRPVSTVVVATTDSADGSSVVSSVSRSDVAVRFTVPVSVVGYRTVGPGSVTQVVHVHPASTVALIPVPAGAPDGALEVSGVARSWETLPPVDHTVTWFAPDTAGSPIVVAAPGPGATAASATSPITLVFSTTVADALGASRPTLPSGVDGTWSEPTAHELVFTPSGYGYGPGASVAVGFDHPVRVAAAGAASAPVPVAASSYTFSVAPGSVLRLEQLLAQLHYLPLRFTPAAGTTTPTTLAAEESTTYSPLAGTFSWRYTDIPPSLATQWSPGQATVMVKGALMAFEAAENTYNYTMDHETVAQIATASTWKALFEAALAHKVDPYPYSYVYVSKTLPETLTLWEEGHVVLTSLTNTGIPQDPTADGTYPIYLRYVENYMSGTNPNGTHYDDLVHWINYFNGSDAVHGFVRAAYGFPQSLGCAELPVATAAEVFPHLAIGDLVTIAN